MCIYIYNVYRWNNDDMLDVKINTIIHNYLLTYYIFIHLTLYQPKEGKYLNNKTQFKLISMCSILLYVQKVRLLTL